MSAISPISRPWQVTHDFDTEGRTTIIGNVDGEIIDGTTHHTYDFVARTLDDDDDSQSRSVAVANAAFIVRACNSHDAMLSALRDAVVECERSERLSFRLQQRIRAAIAKAERGQ